MDELDPPLAGLPSPRENTRLIGHEAIIDRFELMWRAKSMHHAILLTGPRGIGKATLAYQIAKLVLARASSIEDALPTEHHRQIAQGASQRFRRLARSVSADGRVKREIGVDDVRALTPFLRQRTSSGDWKVVLIDAANDLNDASANALLKIVEEPGERTLFLIVAHGDGSLLATIRSRCLRLMCRPLETNELSRALEPSDLSADDTERVLPFARGSVRRAIELVVDGGLDAIEQLDRLLSRPRLGTNDLHSVVDRVAGRAGEGVFALLCDAVPTALRERSLNATFEDATRLANASGAIERELAEREEYGIDRSLSMRTALQRAHAAVWAG